MKKAMVLKKIFLALGAFGILAAATAQTRMAPPGKDRVLRLSNKRLTLAFDFRHGQMELLDGRGMPLLQHAYFSMNGLASKDSDCVLTWTADTCRDGLGRGAELTVRAAFPEGTALLWRAILYDDRPFVVLQMGVEAAPQAPLRVLAFSPLQSPDVFPGVDLQAGYQVLDGNDGGNATRVRTAGHVRSFNNLLVRCGRPSRILVAGGLTYHQFEKFVEVNRKNGRLSLLLQGEDPVGRLVDAGKTIWLDEKYYLCPENEDPFSALEQYAAAFKTAQGIKLNEYDFPTECLWYASYYNRDTMRPRFNDSRGAVTEMKNAVASGITRYTRVAIRLVPDAYGPDNQQGWWDDAHWARWGDTLSAEGPNYVAPYLTTASWCAPIRKMGGLPFTYFQSGRRSEDFARAHPDWMLFNDPARVKTETDRLLIPLDVIGPALKGHTGYWWSDRTRWGYDFTDTGFVRHMDTVYRHLRQAGIRGMMFDYPYNTAWAYQGGFDDPYETTAGAYRKMFQLAYDGLGPHAYLHERNLIRGSDITLGLVASQRVWADNDVMNPEMVGRCGLRWYKNRLLLNYDLDAKDPDKAWPYGSPDGYRAMFTMCYVVSGRFLLGRSFSQLSPGELSAMERVFPFPDGPRQFRPLDAFTTADPWPHIYDLAVNPGWHELVFYNYPGDSVHPRTYSVALGKGLNEGGAGLDSTKSYYAYDFWNDRYLGRYPGRAILSQSLRPGEARVMSLHAVTGYPQVLSTNRHLMQGLYDLDSCRWQARTQALTAKSRIVGAEPYKVILALNDYHVVSCKAGDAAVTCRCRPLPGGLAELTLLSPDNRSVRWTVFFKK